MKRVATLMGRWAERSGLSSRDRDRWVAAGLLHDVLREADHNTLRKGLKGELAKLPGPVLHGPAGAARLAAEGVTDKAILQAVGFHTLGHPGFGRLGRAVSAADFLEPGRTSLSHVRDPLRKLMPKKLDEVIYRIMRERMSHLFGKGRPVSSYSVDFWNVLVDERNR